MSMLKDQVCLVTGANTGIGAVTAKSLAEMGAHVVLACRSETKTQPVLDHIRETGGDVSFLHLDLSDLDQVRSAAEAFLATGRDLHILVNNAGLAGQRGQTAQGFELAFGVNHLGHYLFTRLLMDKLQSHAPARIVNVASAQHKQAKSIDEAGLQKKTRTITGMPEYAVSKLCNVLFTKSLARKYDPAVVSAYSLHPGVVATDVWRRLPAPIAWIAKRRMITVEEGAQTTLHCATNPAVASESGFFYDKCQHRHPNRLAEDEALQDWLWDKSAEWCGLEP